MHSFKEAAELSFSGKSPSYHSDLEELDDQEEERKQVASQNKDDKLTQS